MENSQILTTLKIKHFRSFYEEQSIDFAESNGKPGSGLSIIVGPNNSGKTVLLECLLYSTWVNEINFEKSERHAPELCKITVQSKIGTRILTNSGNGSLIKPYTDGEFQVLFEAIPSRRYWHPNASNSMEASNLSYTSSNNPIRDSSPLEIAGFLRSINKNTDQKARFDKYLKLVFPHFTSWDIEYDNNIGTYVEYRTASGATHKSSLFGDGIISVFRICAHLVADNKTVLIIDEPELSLHPTAQKSLAKIISEASKDKQIIVCTHSPYFANWIDFLNGARFIRLNKPEDKKCTVSFLDNKKSYSEFIKNNYDNWQKPQLLDHVAKEILFAEKILFVEGQEDVGLIKKWADENLGHPNFEIFGYGAGGFGNIDYCLELAKDLGLHKVAALYDNGGNSFQKFTANKTKFSSFYFEILPTDDIRDKFNDGKQKIGCFNGSGNLKPEYHERFSNIMENFVQYFA